ncbi:MAG: sodium:solute symporter family protein [Acidobacteriota bacterium]
MSVWIAQGHFTTLDWALVVGYLAMTVALALLTRGRVSNMSDYVVAGRSLGTSLGVATMIGSELGLVTVMYSAQKGFTGGLAAFHIAVVAGMVTLLVGLTGFIVEPLRQHGVMTIPEYYERRFGRGVRILGGLLLAASGILNMGLFLKAGSIFLTSVTGLDDPFALKVTMTVLLLLVLAYVMTGGMMAVVLTDYVQFVVLSCGLLLSCFLAWRAVGWKEIVAAVETVHGAAGFDPFDGDGFGLRYVIWMAFTAGLVSCAIWQTAVARALSLRDPEDVKRLYRLSSVGFLVRFLIPNFLGVCALAYVVGRSDLADVFLPGGVPAGPEVTLAAMPVVLAEILPAGVLGLITAGMLAAFMSTHDSYLLCWSSVLTQDVVAPLLGDRLSEQARLLLTRSLVGIIGLFLLLWSLWYPLQQDLWDYMAVTGAVYFTGAFAVLLLGLYWRRASRTGAYAALGSGLVALTGLGPIQELLRPAGWPAWSGEDAGLAAVVLALASGVTLSLLRPDGVGDETEAS